MFSRITNFISSIFISNDDPGEVDEDEVNENEEDLLKKIEEHDIHAAELEYGTVTESLQPQQEIYQCFNRTGKVTYLSPEYGLIDGVHYFEKSHVPDTVKIKVNDVVAYMSYRASENETERVHRIFALKDDSWEGNDANDIDDKKQIKVEEKNIPSINNGEVDSFTRKINGQVTKREERRLFVEPSDIWLNLDEIETQFVPVEGDWVSMTAVVSVDENVTDLTGEVLEIKAIDPLLHKISTGRVTLWTDFNKGIAEGAIEKEIYFNQEFCETGYTPALGDEVMYEAIESQQGNYSWRAMLVVALEVAGPENNKQVKDERQQLIRDKNGVSVIGTTDFNTLHLEESKELTLEVKNFGKTNQLLLRSRFHSHRQNSQITLKSPRLDDSFVIKPNESLKYVFSCRGRFLGQSSELFVLHFKNFKIGREFQMNVAMNKDMNKMLKCDTRTVIRKSYHVPAQMLLASSESKQRQFGERPKMAPKFFRGEKPGMYRVPKTLWTTILGESDLPKRQCDAEKDLQSYASYMKEDLSFDTYSDRFHLLLYMEEIAQRAELRRFDMNHVIMRHWGEYLSLEVPGLTEQRPSLIVGDKVIVKQPWSEDNQVENAGYIYEISQKEVHIKFHPSFHGSYNETDCDVYFEGSLSVLHKAHDAINRAMRVLGPKWLFPTAVQEKPPQLIFESIEDMESDEIQSKADEVQSGGNDSNSLTPSVIEFFQKAENHVQEYTNTGSDDLTFLAKQDKNRVFAKPKDIVEYDVDENGFLIPKKNDIPARKCKTIEDKRTRLKNRTLTWFNKRLNKPQKSAVVNILKGQGRPLPFIIFGPPGTGKTVTLVEAVLQIYTLVPASRILIGTPSNSSADLVTIRLIESGFLRPGDLVRVMSFHRATEGSIPEILLPYCTTVDLRDDRGQRDVPKNDCGIRSSSYSQLTGRHRITIGTCGALASLHYIGFSKGHFTHILVDEAGQAMEPEVLILATFVDAQAGQIVLAGDPEQLGPVCISKLAEYYGLGASLLQRFTRSFPYARDMVGFRETNGYDPRFITRLCFNYRSVQEILSLPSQLFYNSELIPVVRQEEGREAVIIKELNVEVGKRETPPALIFHGVRGQNYQEGDCPSWYNPHEIWQSVLYLKRAYSIGLTADDVGIITPYKKQVQKIRSLLTQLDMPVPKIGTVEDFQGQERYVIILSAVRSSLTYIGSDVKHSLGFVASPRRLNVALTRARAVLVVIGNPHVLGADPYWRNVVVYCVKNESYLGCDLPLSVEMMLGKTI